MLVTRTLMHLSSRALLVTSLIIMLGGLAGSTVLFFIIRNSDRGSHYDEFSRFCRRKSAETSSQLQGGATIIQALEQKVVNSSAILTDDQWGALSKQLVNRGSWNVSALSNIHMFPNTSAAVSWARPLGISLRAPTVNSAAPMVATNSDIPGALVVTSSYPNQQSNRGVDYLQNNVTRNLVINALSTRDLVVSVPLNNFITNIRSVILFLPIYHAIDTSLIGAISGVFREDVIIVDKDEDPDIFYTVRVHGYPLLVDAHQPNNFISNHTFSVANTVIDFRCARNYTAPPTPYVIIALGTVLSLFIPLASLQYRRQLKAISKENTARIVAEREATLARVGEAAANEAVEMKSAFLANISHEVRTPLNGIQGNIDFLLESPLSGEQLNSAKTIHESSDVLVSIFDDIIEYTQMDKGSVRANVKLDPVRVDKLLNSLSSDFSLELAQQNDRLLIEYPRDCAERLTILSDHNRLRRIVHKLVHNAIKFTKDGNVTVRVTIPPLSISNVDKEASSFIRFEIIDTGIGISKEAKLFTPFTQEDTSRSRKYGGAGMGLAICKRLTDTLGGRISYQSEPGHGTRFCLELPYVESPLPGSSRQSIVSDRVKISLIDKPLVLIVDDNHVNLTVADRAVKKLGYVTQLVSNGQEAVNAVNEGGGKVSAILMDISMPVMDGYEATRIIREHHADLPIIAVTANVLDTEREKCFAAGMQAFLTKPLNRQTLESTLRDFIKRS